MDSVPSDHLSKLTPCQPRHLHMLRSKYEEMLANLDSDALLYKEVKTSTTREGWPGHAIGVLTSGGDSQGMNAAVRAVVRMGMYVGSKVYYIKEGYQGMIDGGDNIQEATIETTSNIINVGGTFIGSARCMDFQQRQGRVTAALNLLKTGITNLIVIGGDGSLTGANLFRQEWPSLLRELVDKEMISDHKAKLYSHLNIVGLVGSVDNDFCGTEATIGSNSALHRIVDAVDDITTTAVSHKRAFVLEIMGRMCGYLPLLAGLATEASAIFIPEHPPEGDWREYLCDQLNERSRVGEIRRTHIVLVAEGAVDIQGNPIKCNEVRKVLTERLKMDTRVTVLGHVQRGGSTSAFDRILGRIAVQFIIIDVSAALFILAGSRSGVEAVLALMDATPTTPAYVIGTHFFVLFRIPLLGAVEKTRRVGQMMEEKNFNEVIKLRGRSIFHNLYIYLMQHYVTPSPRLANPGRKKLFRVAMIHVGNPACGMNAAARAFVGVCVTQGYVPLFVYNSWRGLCDGNVKVMSWNDVHLWTGKGGSNLGTSSYVQADPWKTAKDVGISSVAINLKEHSISGLVIVGSFEAFQSACQLNDARGVYDEFCIPMAVIPACIANNVPGCDLSLGCDTALNQICKACDDLKQSAISIKKCVNVVEVGGVNCGFLATLGCIATGADFAFIKEKSFNVYDLQEMCSILKSKLEHTKVQHGLILINENANENLTTDFIYRMLNEEGKPQFTARKSILGSTQESNSPSPYDRCSGIKIGCRSTMWLLETMDKILSTGKANIYTNSKETLVVSGMTGGKLSFTPVEDLKQETDFVNCVPKHQWWLKLWPTLDILMNKGPTDDKL